jgi:hypothetical protein
VRRQDDPGQRRPEEAWDVFIDALDRAGQAGSCAGVLVPAFAARDVAGKKFSDLDRDAVKALARVASALGRRGDTIVTLWEDMRRRERGSPKVPGKDRRRARP